MIQIDMDLEKIFTVFFISTYTQADARRRLNILDIVVENTTYKPGEKKTIEQLLNETKMSESDRKMLLEFLSKIKLPVHSQDLKKFFTGLKEQILKRPVVTLTLAFEPTEEQIITYGEWFRKNLNPECLLTIVFSAVVLGGCAITWQGKQITYDLEYILKARRKEILKVVDKYVAIKMKEKVI